MGYSTQIAISLLLFVAFSIPRNSFVQAGGPGPWKDPQTAEIFMSYFAEGMARSGVLTSSQLDDMNDMRQTIMDSMNRMVRQGKSSRHVLEGLNIIFGSSMAEICISEGTNPDVIINAMSDAVSSAFMQTTGTVDQFFVNEMRQLVSMFAQVENDIGGYGASAATAGGSASATATGGYPGSTGGNGAGSGAAAAAEARAGGGYQTTNSGGYQTTNSGGYQTTSSSSSTGGMSYSQVAGASAAGAGAGGAGGYGSGSGGGSAGGYGSGAGGAGGYGSGAGGAGTGAGASGAGTGAGGAGGYGAGSGTGAGAGRYGAGAGNGGASAYDQYSSSSVSSAAYSQFGYGVASGMF